jgi:hypothetical protein
MASKNNHGITNALSFSFAFPLSPSSMEQFHCYKRALHLSLYMILLVFVYMFIFGSVFHVWEKTCGLCVSQPGLLHLTWYPQIVSIHLQTPCHYSLWLSKTPLCIRSMKVEDIRMGFESCWKTGVGSKGIRDSNGKGWMESTTFWTST